MGERYAQALFDLANDQNQSQAVEADLRSLKAAIADSRELRVLLASPAFGAEDKGKALTAIASAAQFNPTTRKFLGLLAANGRASALSAVIAAFQQLSAKSRGTIAAEVTTAVPLTPAQQQGVAAALRASFGRDPEISTRVDPAILGGLRVKVGSRLFDASLKSKLDQMKFALKRA